MNFLFSRMSGTHPLWCWQSVRGDALQKNLFIMWQCVCEARIVVSPLGPLGKAAQ